MAKYNINDKGFKNGDVVQLCTKCNWQTEKRDTTAIARCPKCSTSLIPIGVVKVEKKAPKKKAAKKPAKKKAAAKKSK